MLEGLLGSLSHGLSASAGWALLAAFAWGIASLVLSPCHLASIPLLVAFINGGRPTSGRRASVLALVFGVGIFLAIGVVGALTAALGRMAGDVGPWATYAVAVVFVLAGLSLLDVLPASWNLPDISRWRGRGVGGALVLGVVFGVALGPCTFAYLAPVLGAAFAAGQARIGFGVLLVLAFAIGHCLFIVLAGASTGHLNAALARGGDGRRWRSCRYASGVLVLIGALYLVYSA